MVRLSGSATEYFRLPPGRVVELGSQVKSDAVAELANGRSPPIPVYRGAYGNVCFEVRAKPLRSGRHGEGFRMPAITGLASGHGAGVRKPPMHEPAGLRRWSMGI